MLAEWSGSVYYGGNGSCSGSKTWRSSSSGLGGLICVKKIKIVLAAFSRVFTNPVTYYKALTIQKRPIHVQFTHISLIHMFDGIWGVRGAKPPEHIGAKPP